MYRHYTQAELKDYIKVGMAHKIDKTVINMLMHNSYTVIGTSIGVYGVNGVLVQVDKTGEFYCSPCRSAYTAMLV